MRRVKCILIVALLAPAAMAVTLVAKAEERPRTSYAHIPVNAFSVVAQVRAKPGKEDELRAAALPLIELVRQEPNNLVYFLQEDRSSPGHFTFYEIFVSETDFEAHNATPHVKAFLEKIPELADGDIQVTKMQVLQQPTR